MPYFPTEAERVYRCHGCGEWFIPTGTSCCVAHAPGTCCHYGEQRVGSQESIGPDGKTNSERERDAGA